MKKHLIASFLLTFSVNTNAEVINLVASSSPPSQCLHGTPCDLYGYHEIYAVNANYGNETFNYLYQICLNDMCDNARNQITLSPQQKWSNSRQSHIVANFRKAGNYTYVIRTEAGKEKRANAYTVRIL